MPFDQTSDPNLSALHRYSKLYGLPDFVKSASAAAVYTPEEKKSRLFANPKNLEFPIHQGSHLRQPHVLHQQSARASGVHARAYRRESAKGG